MRNGFKIILIWNHWTISQQTSLMVIYEMCLFVSIGNPRWLPLHGSILTYDPIGKWKKHFWETRNRLNPSCPYIINYHEIVSYKIIIFCVNRKSKLAATIGQIENLTLYEKYFKIIHTHVCETIEQFDSKLIPLFIYKIMFSLVLGHFLKYLVSDFIIKKNLITFR